MQREGLRLRAFFRQIETQTPFGSGNYTQRAPFWKRQAECPFDSSQRELSESLAGFLQLRILLCEAEAKQVLAAMCAIFFFTEES
jgi:hypothetical protein